MKNKNLLLALAIYGAGITNLQGQTPTRTARELLAQAVREASGSHKNIFLVFHASWCGWCRKLNGALNDPSIQGLFRKNYVIIPVTVNENNGKKYLETPGGNALSEQFGGRGQGLPYWVILDSTGHFLANSRFDGGTSDLLTPNNMGCPATAQEVSGFVRVLRNTSLLSEQELHQVGQIFLKNNE